MSYYQGKQILVTGGTGSYGQALIWKLLRENPKEVMVYSRGENAQVEMEREFDDPRLTFYIGDVRDPERLTEATRGMDVIFHFAALKHVPVGEGHSWEFVKTNIAGTRNVIEAAKANYVPRAVFMSSDKAANPMNNYGYTKAIAEKMFIEANAHSPKTTFICIRSGNLTGSHGSVIPLFRDQIARHNRITVTDPAMTRFLEIPGVLAAFVLKMGAEGKGGETFIPKMAAIDLATLADVMVKHLGDKDTRIEYVGPRPGERFHEVLVAQDEVCRTLEFAGYFVVFPYPFLADEIPQLAAYRTMSSNGRHSGLYSSEIADKLTHQELAEKLRDLGFVHDYRAKIQSLGT